MCFFLCMPCCIHEFHTDLISSVHLTSTHLPRILQQLTFIMSGQNSNVNLEGANCTQAILDALAALGRQVGRFDNKLRRFDNSMRLSHFCLTAQPVLFHFCMLKLGVYRLSEVQTTRILQALQVAISVGLPALRDAVMEQFARGCC